jgi:hypothetical protein
MSHSVAPQQFKNYFVMLWMQVTSGIYTSLTYPVHRVKILLQTQDANPRIISGVQASSTGVSGSPPPPTRSSSSRTWLTRRILGPELYVTLFGCQQTQICQPCACSRACCHQYDCIFTLGFLLSDMLLVHLLLVVLYNCQPG